MFGSLLELKWNRGKNYSLEFGEGDDNILNRMALLKTTNLIMLDAKQNILYYTFGHVILKISKLIGYTTCINSLVINSNEDGYFYPYTHSKLIHIKNQGEYYHQIVYLKAIE